MAQVIFESFLAGLATVLLWQSAIFLIGQKLKRFDVVDIGWGLSFLLITITGLILSLLRGDLSNQKLLVASIVSVWGLRLSYHILRRFMRSTKEDARYVELRSKWRSSNMNRSIYLRIFVTQAILASLVSLPVAFILASEVTSVSSWLYAGLIVWVIGFAFEVIADSQLRTFITNPAKKGQLMTSGLWAYSRHPNYFGEITLWWGLGLMALGVSYGWVALIGPALITYLLIFVSGIPPAERSAATKPGWDSYKRKTSPLIPLPIRK